MNVISTFTGAQDFLNLSYPCNIIWQNQPFPSLWHAMVAGMTKDRDIRNALSDNRYAMYPQVIASLWKQVTDVPDYKIKVVDMIISKYTNPSLMNMLLSYTNNNDQLVYVTDPTGIVGDVTMMIRKGRNAGEILQTLNLQ